MAQSLVERLGKEPIRTKVVDECVDLVEAQVKSKGFMIKRAYAAIKAVKKRFVPEVIDTLLDDWLAKMQLHYDKWDATKPGAFSDYIIARSDDVAEDLLSVTDERAERSSHGTTKKIYAHMRDSAKKNVVEAIPDLARLIERRLAA